MPLEIRALADTEGHNDQPFQELGTPELTKIPEDSQNEGTVIPFGIGVTLILAIGAAKIREVFNSLNEPRIPANVSKSVQASILGLSLISNPPNADAQEDECEIPADYSPNLILVQAELPTEADLQVDPTPTSNRNNFDRIYTTHDLASYTNQNNFFDSAVFQLGAGLSLIAVVCWGGIKASTVRVTSSRTPETVDNRQIIYDLDVYQRRK